MATDSPSHGPRRHFHRGRRGQDRRGADRRGPQQQGPPQGQGARGDHVDVEQIMREIRSRIAQRHGIDLTDQQVQELAARQLESILDPRTIKPSLLDELRRSAGIPTGTARAAGRIEAPDTFEEAALYESPNGLIRFMRKLLHPVLKLFFDPGPLARALQAQSRASLEAARREAEREQRQAEWNALHYDLLRRLVTEVAKVSLEAQSLALRVESLSAKLDFNERRVRGIEGSLHQGRGPRDRDREREREREPALPPVSPGVEPPLAGAVAAAPDPAAPPPGEAPRRRRRRRRGRRGGSGEAAAPAGVDAATDMEAGGDETGGDEPDDIPEANPADGGDAAGEAVEPLEAADATGGTAPGHALEPAATAAPVPERVTPQLENPAPDAREAAAPELAAPPEAPEGAPGPPSAPLPDPDRDEPR